MNRDVGRRARVGEWLVVAAFAAGLSVGFESRAPAQGQGQGPGAASGRRVPDALRFAHGLLRQGKYELAAEEYERFLASGPPVAADRGDALYGLANARLNQERYADSLRAFGGFLAAAAPGDGRARTARYRVGELSYITGDMPAARRALEAFTAGKADHPAMETAWTYLGDVYFSQNDLPAARKAYERSLADHPRGRLADRARYGLGRTLAALGERDRAIRELRELAARGGPDWVDRGWYQVGTIELAAGRPAAAVEAFEAMERASPSSPLKNEARLRRARALEGLGRTDDAARLLAGLAADAAGSQAPQAALELATIEMQRHRPEAALAAVEAALKGNRRSPAGPALLFRSAEALRELHRPDEAEARFLQVAETAPDDPWADDALDRAAASALGRKDAAAARRIAARLAARYPSSPLKGDARLIEARAAAMAGEPKAAVEILERLLGMAGAGAAAGEAEKSSLSPAAARDARYELALAYRAVGRPADAEKLLAGLAAEPAGPLAADAQFLLGQSHLEAGRFAEAIPPLEHYLAAQPRGEVAEFALADLVAARVGVKRLDEAARALETLARQFPRGKALPGARLRYAEAALTARQFDRAAEQFRLAGGLSGEKPKPGGAGVAAIEPAIRLRALVGLGRALEALGKHAEAAEAFAGAGELMPAGDASAVELAMDRARALEAGNRSDEALAAYADLAARAGGRPEGLNAAVAYARLLAKLGRHEQAASEFGRLAGDDPARDALAKLGMSPDALLAEQGWALVDAGKPAEADRVFTRLLEKFPDSPHAAEARFNLAESANQDGRHAEVVRLLLPLAASGKPASGNPAPAQGDPSARLMPAVLYRLGRSQAELKDWKPAAGTLERLLAEFPDNPYRREARFLRAEAALQLGDAAAAEKDLAALLAEPARPDDPPGLRRSVRLEQVRCRVVLRQWKELVPEIQALRAELKPDDPAIAELDYAQGQASMGLGRRDDARKSFQAVIAARRGGELAAQAQLMRGETYFHEGRLREALREFLQVDILYGEEAPRWQAAALLEAGKVYERLDKWADAAEIYDRLVAKLPANDPDAATARSRGEAARKRAAKPAQSAEKAGPGKTS